jgi:tRNA1Val (adenine37-N6)-methyltransferase
MDVTLLADEHIHAVNEGLSLIQKNNGLTFGTDAFLLAAYVTPEPRALCVDLGSGTGIISLLLAQKGKVARAVGVEVQAAFAKLIDKNAALNGLADRVSALHTDVRELSQIMLGAHVGEEQGRAADIVVCNPPYMKTQSGARNEHDEKFIARHEVCGDIGDFCAAAARVLRFGGRFYVVYRPDRLGDLMAAMRAHALEPKRMTFVHADAESEPSMVLIEARAGGSVGLKVTAPLILHEVESRGEKSRALSAAAEKVYKTMTFER